MKRFGLALGVLFLAAFSLTAAENWEPLGKRSVTFKADRDEIVLGKKEGTFSKIMLRVTGNDVEIDHLVVTYGTGAKDEIPVRHLFNKNSRSRVIDLKGGKRVIRKITLFYHTAGKLREGRAELEVFGRP